ncbi:uncharacterized protein ARMOST_18107 [Armillaria ostoyae]|uniref:Uncharacterized protein n=1 Tax=Armillaria ostoyae TaxID=47428 RepID=A0A284S0V5_ARMOS|nr:uncharacterized protein ARMOST_18107 [Armillaria ostoyae]
MFSYTKELSLLSLGSCPLFFGIILATNRLEAVDALTGTFMPYACDGTMDRALGADTERKRRKSYQWKGRNKEGKGSRDEERPSKDTSFAVALEHLSAQASSFKGMVVDQSD